MQLLPVELVSVIQKNKKKKKKCALKKCTKLQRSV